MQLSAVKYGLDSFIIIMYLIEKSQYWIDFIIKVHLSILQIALEYFVNKVPCQIHSIIKVCFINITPGFSFNKIVDFLEKALLDLFFCH